MKRAIALGTFDGVHIGRDMGRSTKESESLVCEN